MKSPEKRKLFLDEIVVQSHIKLDLIEYGLYAARS